MPRNSAGTFSLVAGNPVVDDTVIEATWANDTLNDLAAEITDSLSRSGKGGMLVPMEFADGTAADPAITFSAAPTTGLYRAGTNDVRFSLAGTDLIQLAATIIKFIARVTDGASAVGLEIDTTNALTTTAKLLRVLNHAVEKFYLDINGGAHTDLVQALSAVGATLKGNVADGATAVGVILDNVGALANAAAKALSVRVAGVEKAYVDKDGEVRGLGGLYGVGKANGTGVTGVGNGSGDGVYGEGGATDGDGVVGLGTGTGSGVVGTGGATSAVGVYGVGGAPNGYGVYGVGDGAASGVGAVGGDNSGPGLGVTGGAPNGNGISGSGTGSGAGIQVYGGATGPGGVFGAGGGGSPTRAAINLAPQAAPSDPANGDMWVELGTHTLKVRINGTTRTVTVT